jgi:peptide/nickel transport system substrate-binding protein
MRLNLALLATGVAACVMMTAAPSFAQKQGGTLRISHRENPPSASLLEESTVSVIQPFMAVFNNLVVFDPNEKVNSPDHIVPDLAESWSWNDDKTRLTFKLRPGVKWHDGQPFTADDCVFNWQYAADPATAATTIGTYKDIKVSKVDDLTIKIDFQKPTPFWADAFVGARNPIIPKHLFEQYKGASSREAPANLKPVGTGPYMFVDFKPGDIVRGKMNPNYHMPNRPYFDAIEMKGGGDAVSAARAVLQTGEYDFAWNMQVEDELLKRLEQSGKGHANIFGGGSVEHIEINNTDPWKEVDGERSSVKTTHPFLGDPAVRQALNLWVDRLSVEKFIYPRQSRLETRRRRHP